MVAQQAVDREPGTAPGPPLSALPVPGPLVKVPRGACLAGHSEEEVKTQRKGDGAKSVTLTVSDAE